MAECKVDSVVGDLKNEEARLKSSLAELRTEFRKKEQELQKDLKRVQAGLGALGGKAGKPSKGGKKSGSPKPEKPSVEVVGEVAGEVLEGAGSLAEERLVERVTERLAARGQSTADVASQLQKALKEPRFTNGALGWKLAEHRVKAPTFHFESAQP